LGNSRSGRNELCKVGTVARIQIPIGPRPCHNAVRFQAGVLWGGIAIGLILSEQDVEDVSIRARLAVVLCAAVFPAKPEIARPVLLTAAVAAAVTKAAINIEARAQAKKPCAVSRKNTSSVWRPVHFVRSRPAK
jgi:hypothetical protein